MHIHNLAQSWKYLLLFFIFLLDFSSRKNSLSRRISFPGNQTSKSCGNSKTIQKTTSLLIIIIFQWNRLFYILNMDLTQTKSFPLSENKNQSNLPEVSSRMHFKSSERIRFPFEKQKCEAVSFINGINLITYGLFPSLL